MPEDDTAATRKAQAAPERRTAKADEPRSNEPAEYDIERLIADSEGFLGYPSHEAAGGLHGVKEKTMTVADAKAAVKKWLKTEIDPPDADADEEV